ncbi:MAG TPA: sulfatase [Armatimonadota bacterium]
MARITLHHRLLPLKLGILLGLVIGGCFGIRTVLAQDYISCGLYNSSASVLASHIDLTALAAVAALYLLWAAFLAGNFLTGTARSAYRAITVTSFVLVLLGKMALLHFGISALRDINISSLLHDKYTLAALAAGVAVFAVWVYAASTAERDARAGEITRKAVLLLDRQATLFSLAAALFVLANITAGALQLHSMLNSSRQPNVIVVMVDTLRADHVGYSGYSRNTTPNIDRFSQSSTRFERAVAQASWTTPSVTSFMTSRYPQTLFTDPVVGPPDNYTRIRIPDNFTTIAEFFKDRGYTTGAVISNPQFSRRINADQGFDFFDDTPCGKDISSPDVFAGARKWISAHNKQRFFLYVLFMDPHSPFVGHPAYNFDPAYQGKDARQADVDPYLDKNWHPTCGPKHLKALYDSEIAFTDTYVGRLFDELKKKGVYDDSMIIFLSDHGEGFGEHGAYFHGRTLYNELLNVPLAIKLPGQRRGKVVAGVFPLLDLFPSILKSIGIDPEVIHPQGKAYDIEGARKISDDYCFSATRLSPTNLRAVQNLRYKCITNSTPSKTELYDLVKDPMERINIADKDRRTLAAFQSAIDREEADLQRRASGGSKSKSANPSASERQRLHSLGYAQ